MRFEEGEGPECTHRCTRLCLERVRLAKRRRLGLWRISWRSSASGWGWGRRLSRSHVPNGVRCLNWPCIQSRPKARKPPTRSAREARSPRRRSLTAGPALAGSVGLERSAGRAQDRAASRVGRGSLCRWQSRSSRDRESDSVADRRDRASACRFVEREDAAGANAASDERCGRSSPSKYGSDVVCEIESCPRSELVAE
jgi:hypothetical protein